MLRMISLLFVLSLSLVGIVCAQSTAPAATNQAATITAAQVEHALSLPAKTGINDIALRVVPIDSEYNVGVFAVRRAVVNGKLAVDAYQHHKITEVYQIVHGSGTLVTGGSLEQAREFSPDDPSVLKLIGPTAQGSGIKGGAQRHVGPGDIVIIPADTPHGFIDLAPEGISYLLVRIDPQRILPAR